MSHFDGLKNKKPSHCIQGLSIRPEFMPSISDMLMMAANNFSHSGYRPVHLELFSSVCQGHTSQQAMFNSGRGVRFGGRQLIFKQKVSTLPNYSYRSLILSCLGDQDLRAFICQEDQLWVANVKDQLHTNPEVSEVDESLTGDKFCHLVMYI